MLRDRIQLLERQMRLKLDEIRATHTHAGNKGANVEVIVRDFLREFLPPFNRIGHGEIIDLNDNISSQTDVIVTNEHHPFLNDLTAPSLFFIEGIACAGEVKSVLTLEELERTLTNCRRFKALKVTLQKGMIVRSNQADIKRFVEKRPYFLFAFETKTPVLSICERFNAFNAEN